MRNGNRNNDSGTAAGIIPWMLQCYPGSVCWKEPCREWEGKVIFLGDYHDPYPQQVSKNNSLENLKVLINFSTSCGWVEHRVKETSSGYAMEKFLISPFAMWDVAPNITILIPGHVFIDNWFLFFVTKPQKPLFNIRILMIQQQNQYRLLGIFYIYLYYIHGKCCV